MSVHALGYWLLAQSRRLCAVEVINEGFEVILICVYMPCDSNSDDDQVYCYNEILCEISSIRESTGISNCIICGDFNTDPSRNNSAHTRSLRRFADYEGIIFCCNLESSDIDYTFESKMNGARSCIDHVLASSNLFDSISQYKVPEVDNKEVSIMFLVE